MSTLATTVFCFFILEAVVSVSTAEPGLTIRTNPSEINVGVTSSLDINCTFSLEDHQDMAAFVSLNLARANPNGENFEELADITQVSPDSPTLMTQEKVIATGVHSQTGESFLNVRWEFPTALQAGVYKCSANGMDMYGHPLEVTNISTVTVDKANLNDSFERLQETDTSVQNSMSAVQNDVSDIQSELSAMENRIETLEKTVVTQDSYIQSLEYEIAQIKCYITLQKIPGVVSLVGNYNNNSYFISRQAFADINTSMDACKSYGGHLAEISDENKFRAVQGFLNNTFGFEQVVIAGTDAASEGNWRFQSNSGASPYIIWSSGQPDGGSGKNCLAFCNVPSAPLMCDLPCHYDSPIQSIRFMCEIPCVE